MSGAEKKDITMTEVSLARPCILIVDDDEGFLEGAREFLSTQGYAVDTARTPADATQILKDSGHDKYQLVVVDINFGDLSKVQGDEFVLQNRSLFGEARKVVLTGGGWFSSPRREELRKAGVSLLEKSPGLTKNLESLIQEENRPSNLMVKELKRVLVNWLRSRSNPEEPVLYYGNRVYTANELAKEVPNDTEVGSAHLQMLLSEVRHSLGID